MKAAAASLPLAITLLCIAASCSPGNPPPVRPATVPLAEPLLPAQPPTPLQSVDFAFSAPLAQGSLVLGTAPAGTIALALEGSKVAVAGDGRFVLGLDRDQSPEAVLEGRLADGRTFRKPLAVAPRQWRIERIDLALRPSASTAEWLRLRAAELARIAAARALDPVSDGWRQRFIWPARGRISGQFGSQRIYRGQPAAYHSGVDVAAAGAPVVAPADGVVVLAGPPAFSLEGNLVIVAHGMGLNSAFLHLARVAVREGQSVRQGERIGTVGSSGRATGPHLHWSMKWNDARIDPQMLVGPM